jgi:hypothetical protein
LAPSRRALRICETFPRVVGSVFNDIISSTYDTIRYKYESDLRSSQNPISSRNQQLQITAAMPFEGNPAAAAVTNAFTIPTNSVPPPPLANCNVFQLPDSTHRCQIDTLRFLWDKYHIGEESLYSTIITSPHAMRFNERMINSRNVEHAALYNASFMFLHPYPNIPQFEWGIYTSLSIFTILPLYPFLIFLQGTQILIRLLPLLLRIPDICLCLLLIFSNRTSHFPWALQHTKPGILIPSQNTPNASS